MYVMYIAFMDTACERYIFRIIPPINFKFDLLCHITVNDLITALSPIIAPPIWKKINT